ncbi:MAG: hypothetical protein MO846_03170 [Candidatus Devosia symbiotica]|nr:hypothetical protein [Candidatus Devosia symbiotica]
MTITDNTLNADGALIVGAGLAGLFTALKLAPRLVTALSPKPLGIPAPVWPRPKAAWRLPSDWVTVGTPTPSIPKWQAQALSIAALPKA